MRKLSTLITAARRRTKNENYEVDSTTGVTRSGIPDDLFVEWANDAQDHLQAAILAAFPNEFVSEKTINIVANQEAYTISDNVFINNKLICVEYSFSGNARDYEILDQGTIRDRQTYSGYPNFYIRISGQILLNPIPKSSQGTIRVSYYRELDDLDVRRAQVNGTPSGSIITVDTMSAVEQLRVNAAEYLSICDAHGEPLLYAAPISTSGSTTTITLTSAVSGFLVSGVALAGLDNGIVTLHKYGTTHSKLPTNCERYIKTYMQKRALTAGESNTSLEEDAELLKIEEDIIASFNDESRDIEFIPIIDEDIIY